MPTTLNKSAFEKLVAEDRVWLATQPRTLEREHIDAILKVAADRIYTPAPQSHDQSCGANKTAGAGGGQ